MQVHKATGHVPCHQLPDISRPAVCFQQKQPGFLCMMPDWAEGKVSMSFCWARQTHWKQSPSLAHLGSRSKTHSSFHLTLQGLRSKAVAHPSLGGWSPEQLTTSPNGQTCLWHQVSSECQRGGLPSKALPRTSQGKEERRWVYNTSGRCQGHERPAWSPCQVFMPDVHVRSAGLVCVPGLHAWSVCLVFISGLHAWSVCLVSMRGLQTRSVFTLFDLG